MFHLGSLLTRSLSSLHVKANPKQTSRKGYVCTICGFVYEGEELPEGYVCPLCMHGTDYFEPIE